MPEMRGKKPSLECERPPGLSHSRPCLIRTSQPARLDKHWPEGYGARISFRAHEVVLAFSN